jgi:hypothetical protein
VERSGKEQEVAERVREKVEVNGANAGGTSQKTGANEDRPKERTEVRRITSASLPTVKTR